jgi:hypothetical protein
LSTEERLPPSQNDLEALLDPKGQKGVQWRMQKLSAIRRLVKSGKTKAWVVWFLRTKTGLTISTARSLVEDAFLEEPKGGIEDMAGVSFSIRDDRIGWKTRDGTVVSVKDRHASTKKLIDILSGKRGEGTEAKKSRSASAKSEHSGSK